ncbi:melatonin receptor type 1A-like [Physella acuta]|uniref:melatonin receptor type 1A-like n=1 Tax=Physella acuta TaxID=109671 RepID=UPI0027DBC83C|nr:melatonin receptor type 1A-like [Physella acuta]
MAANQTEQTMFEGELMPQPERDVFLVIGWLLVINGVFGNVVIIVTLFTCKSLRSVHHLFIGNLAVADLIIEGYFATFFLVDISIGYHPVVDMTNCIINGYIVVVCYMCSLWTLVSISFNRYLHICHNSIFKALFSDSRTKGHLVLVWVWAGIVSLPPVLGWGRYSYDPKTHYCGFDRLSSRSFTIVLATSSVALPCLLVCYFNFAIYRYVRSAGKRIQNWDVCLKRRVSKSDINMMKSLFVVFVCLAVFMTPYMMSLLIDTDNSWPSTAHVACTCTSILNSSINWLLYGLMNHHFRHGYKELLDGSINWLLYGLMNHHFRHGYKELLDGFLRLVGLKTRESTEGSELKQKQENTLESTC